MKAAQTRPSASLTLAAALGAATLCTATHAAADSIYLVSGRVIHSESVRVADGRVYFTQFGGAVSIPLEEVARIVADHEAESTARPEPVSAANTRAAGADPDSKEMAAGESGRFAASPETDASATPAPAPPSSEPAYWIERILEVDQRIARVQTELDRLPLYDQIDQRLLRFSGQALYFIAEREKWEALMRDLKMSRQRLLRGARRAGISPGALRDGLRVRVDTASKGPGGATPEASAGIGTESGRTTSPTGGPRSPAGAA